LLLLRLLPFLRFSRLFVADPAIAVVSVAVAAALASKKRTGQEGQTFLARLL
jgi:hypothetical protein